MPDCRQPSPSLDGGALPQGALSRLDHATKLVREQRQMWVLTVYPDAGEAGGSWVWVGRELPPCESLVPDPDRAGLPQPWDVQALRYRARHPRRCALGRRRALPALAVRSLGAHARREEEMKLITRIAVAIGSLMALVLAGGSHWKG
jgi:hypothetical protein